MDFKSLLINRVHIAKIHSWKKKSTYWQNKGLIHTMIQNTKSIFEEDTLFFTYTNDAKLGWWNSFFEKRTTFFRNSLLKKTFSIAFERSWWVANFSKAFRESSSSTSPVFGEEGTEGIWAKVKLFDIFLLNAFSELMPFTVF